jgi:O-methyltransferase
LDQKILALIDHTKMRGARLRHWIETLSHLDVAGDIVECGVWRGGAMLIARAICPDRRCWLYDTFTGMTEPTAADRKVSDGQPALTSYTSKLKAGRRWNAAALEEVRQNFIAAGLYDENRLRFIVGPVEQTLRSGPLPERIAVLRLDTDWHASTKIELEVLFPRLVQGGTLVIDDFGHWAGARQAAMEYFGGAGGFTPIDYSAVARVKR